MNTSKQALAGQAVYSRTVLSLYDWWVLGISNSLFWKCPTSRLVALFNQHLSANHLDIGVGTGYFLDRCRFPEDTIRLALMDLNSNSLEVAAARVSRYHPEVYRQNILEPITQHIQPFDSISVNYLLHCLPGALAEKAIAFDHLNVLLKENGTVFGSTILQGELPRNFLAKRLMKVYNRKGIFSNTQDELEVLHQCLGRKYAAYQITVEGCVARFWAKKGGGR